MSKKYNDCPICGKELVISMRYQIQCKAYSKLDKPHYIVNVATNSIDDEYFTTGKYRIRRDRSGIDVSTAILSGSIFAYEIVLSLETIFPFKKLTEDYIDKMLLLL